MKKFLFLCVVFFPGMLKAEGDAPTAMPPPTFTITSLSAGMYSFPSENKIPDNAVSYIQNFYTDIQPLVVERNGSTRRDSTILGGGTGANVTQLARFVDASGNEWIISFSSQTFYKNTIGNTPTAFGLSPTVTTKPRYAINLGKIWFVNGANSLWWFDGTTTGTVAGAPIGTLIVPWRQRLVIGNVTNTQSTLYISGDGDGTDWTVNIFSTSSFTVPIGGANDGENVRCLQGSYLDTLVIGKKYSLWGIAGFSQADYVNRNISYEVGCIEPDTMREKDGTLMWLSTRGMERMNGSSIQPISEPIRDLTDVLVKNTVNQRSNVQTTAQDWGSGTSDNNVYTDTQTSSGDLQLTFPDSFDTFRDGSKSTKSVWQSYCKSVPVCSSNTSISNGNLVMTTVNGITGEDQVIGTRNLLNNYKVGTTYYLVISSITPDVTNGTHLYMVFSSTQNTAVAPTSYSNYFYFDFKSTTTGRLFLNAVKNSSDLTLCSGNCQTGDSAIPATIAVVLSTTGYSTSINGSTVTGGAHTYTNQAVYAYMDFFSQIASNGSVYLDQFGIVPETMTYTSQLISIGNSITSWGPATISDTKTNGNITYQFGSTTTAAVSSISNYASITTGQIPSVSTGPYAAFKAAFSETVATATVKLGEFDTTWNEGSANPSPVSWVYDRRYWMSFTTATTSNPTYDTVLVFQRNDGWTIFKGINAASFTLWRDHLYFGNSNATGLVYLFDVGNNDDGNSITALLNTKAYDLGFSYRNKDIRYAYLTYLANTSFSGSFSAAYDVDSQGTPFSLGSANMNEAPGINPAKFQFPLTNPTQGYTLKFLLSKTGTGDRLKLYDVHVKYYLKEGK